MPTLGKGLMQFAVLFLLLNAWLSAQSLADLARKEREKRAQNKAARKVYTNEDLSKYESQRSDAASPHTEPVSSPSRPVIPPLFSADDSEERLWSKRFIEAKARVQEAKAQTEALQAKLNDLNLRLLRQSDVFDRENVYTPLIAQTRQQLEKSKSDAAAAEQALEELREELRKSGNPVSWENSQAALKPDPKESKPEEPKVKDQQYWQDKLVTIDKRYNALIAPLETERFQLLNRRDPKEGENVSAAGSPGLGVPPRVIDIDIQIRELNDKRAREKQELIDQAIREGALPGWFR